jgi:hypothetical protein
MIIDYAALLLVSFRYQVSPALKEATLKCSIILLYFAGIHPK